MDVFDLRENLIGEFSEYAKSFISIRDERIKALVDDRLTEGLLWPDPKVQLNPAFERGASVDQLVEEGVLHSECANIFRRGKKEGSGPGSQGQQMHLHRHQEEAIRTARSGENYVLTTGTGSGKSLAYIIPIVDHVLRRGSGKGIQAVIVYPMNALANSQFGELKKFLSHGYPAGQQPVTWRRYTGQESDEERNDIIANPPDILLTNYVMLELILTRPAESKLVKQMHGLQFLVFDELHTYRGRQGADVALLIRRVRDACASPRLQHVGTSATLAGQGSVAEQKIEVANLASLMFGAEVRPDCIIGETLRRATRGKPSAEALKQRLAEGDPPALEYEAFVQDPLACWIELNLGLREEPGTGILVRQTPVGVTEAGRLLAAETGVDEQKCRQAIQRTLLAGYQVQDPETSAPVFAFRLHQFISRGDTVYATIESPKTRAITADPQRFAPGTRDRVLLPLAFCRECGQEYYVVHKNETPQGTSFSKRELRDQDRSESSVPGFLYVSDDDPWPDDDEDELLERVPSEWVEEAGRGQRIKHHSRRYLPKRTYVQLDAKVGGGGTEAWFVPAPFRFCLKCGVVHSAYIQSDLGKLATLGTEGRSTATTILSITALRSLKADDSLAPEARKLLSFTDNRQDAALQSGHFNDFVEVGLLRSGLYHAAEQAGAVGITHDRLAAAVVDAMGLEPADYAVTPDVKFAAARRAKEALLNVVGYRLYRDLQRGWRLTSPNLEQCGLLQIGYEDLAELCADEASWNGTHQALIEAEPALREEIAKALLDHMRRSLAIKVEYLDPEKSREIQSQSYANLRDPWDISSERMEYWTVIFPRAERKERDGMQYKFVSGHSGLARYLGRIDKLGKGGKLRIEDKEQIIRDLLWVLSSAGIVEQVVDAEGPDDPPGYQLRADAMRWFAGDGTTPAHDPVRVPRLPSGGARVNEFFVDYYRTKAASLKDLRSAEHTAQVTSEERERREADFRQAKLPVLFCSPTMELGVDISELNCVNMRNVPPSPANYAQRSGRAGRSGQPALVFTYCSAGSPHDQYFFRRPEEMVSGQVTPPRIDLSNEDLLRAHVHSIWIREAELGLGRSLAKVLDVEGDQPTLAIRDDVRSKLEDPASAQRARERAARVLSTIPAEMMPPGWNMDQWLDGVMRSIARDFEMACDRWRGLYRAALAQQERATKTMRDASASPPEKQRAKTARAEAEAQLQLLLAESDRLMQSDFYSYRYFASEGFLPGYNFPRLPLSAFIPGSRGNRGHNEYLSRPRFLAISEFGPRAYVYHDGLRYQIVKAILPVEAEGTPAEGLVKQSVKICDECGYLHPLSEEPVDVCESCGAILPAPIEQLFRLTNVGTTRRDRINSDEEERQRQGFELRTAFRYAEYEGEILRQTAEVMSHGDVVARLSYGHAAEIWRMNLGLRRRKEKNVLGFVIDIDSGYWAKTDTAEDTSPGEEEGAEEVKLVRTERVVPFVQDRRNCLVVEPSEAWDETVMASLAAALKSAIQVEYQLEDSELATEPLPSRDNRRSLLFYEAAEGGAGVLRRLVEDPQALPRVAARALDLCHFGSDGTDLGHAPRAKEPCMAACYDCLMSYYNQPDHDLLDRFQVHDILLLLAGAEVAVSPSALPRETHFERLMRLTDSELERTWLTTVRDAGMRLPSDAQTLIEAANARPDFLYREHSVAIFIDGPHHDDARTAAEDMAKREALENLGYTVIAFRFDDDWPAILKRFPEVFGGSR